MTSPLINRRESSLFDISRLLITGVVAAVGLLAVPATASAATASPWPSQGQAAYVLGDGRIHVGPRNHEAPIASVAKVMTAYLVLEKHPLHAGDNGFVLHVHPRDVRDEQRRAAEDQSVVAVKAGERLPERQALLALLLPSANNIAIMLARRVGGTVKAFVHRMNRTARRLHMHRTHYTDPSGYLSSTQSTAADQLRLALVALRRPVLRHMVRRSHARIPVAGRIENTDTLLGRDGFVGVKTGSTGAAGGCFVLASWRIVRGRRVLMTGVVLGQYGGNLIDAGLDGAKYLVDHVAPRAARGR